MRFTLDRWGDVEVDPGLRLVDARPALVALTGDPRLGDVVLSVNGVPLAAEQRAGVPPWTQGSRTTLGSGRPDDAALAAAADWHVAVTAGPDAGRVGAPARRGRVVVGRDPAGTLAVTDPEVSRHHLCVRPLGRRGRPRSPRAWLVRDLASANGSRVRGRSVRLTWLRTGDDLRVGATTLRVRAHGPEVRTAGSAPAEPPGAARPPAPRAATWLVPVLVGTVVAVVLGSPVFLVLALAGPVAAVLPVVVARARRRRRGPVALAPDPAAVRLAATTATGLDEPAWATLDGPLAVVAPRATGVPVARALVGAALVARPGHVRVTGPGTEPQEWAGLRWSPARPTVPDDGVTVLDLHATSRERGPAPARPPSRLVVVLAETAADVPPWCRHVVTPDPWTLAGPGGREPVRVPSAGVWWLDDVCRRLARGPAGDPGPPVRAALEPLLPRDVPGVLDAWRASTGLPAVLGRGRDGSPVEVDLVRDGPHALVAGTTGAGKSAFLQALLLGLCARVPPTDLAVVLVDHKGGASFGPCRHLPHVAGTVTDLDPGGLERALAGLRVELRRREGLVAAAGVTDVDGLRSRDGGVPRLLVVVDEFRALREDQPDVVPALVRLAAQGRSLGMHLVLATQRPGGAVDAQMRANLGLRVCLRVADPADSTDVVGVADAADIPPDLPGRAVLRRGPGGVELLQTAWPSGPGPAAVRAATAWQPDEPAPGADGAGEPALAAADPVALVVDMVGRAAQAAGHRSPEPPWLPPLPAHVTTTDLPDDGGPGLPLALADVPERCARATLRWEPSAGPLLVVGGPRSGRSTALRTLAATAAAEVETHVIGTDASVAGPGAATVVGPDDPRRAARLLTLLLSTRSERARLLLVDDADAVARALDRLPGEAPVLLDRLVRDARHVGLGVAVAGPVREVSRLLPHAVTRLVLPTSDPHDAVLLGLPRGLPTGPPGRGTWSTGGSAVSCQVAVATRAGHVVGGVGEGVSGPPRPLVAAIPRQVRPADLARSGHPADSCDPAPRPGWAVPLGLGGDAAGPVVVDASAGVLVLGPPGSGRSTALAVLTDGMRAHGLVVREHGRPTGATTDPGRPGTAVGEGADPQPAVLVVDDLDLALRRDPSLETALTASTRAGVVLVASVRTETAATAFRGVVADIRGAADLVVLQPGSAGSREAAGGDLSAAVDPTRPGPGWAAVVRRGRVVPVQVARR